MNEYVAVGFISAIVTLFIFAVIWQWAANKADRWGYSLTRDTHAQLRDASMKLESIHRNQEQILSHMHRLERAADNQNSTLQELKSRLSHPKATP